MKTHYTNFKQWTLLLFAIIVGTTSAYSATDNPTSTIVAAKKVNPTTVDILFKNKQRLTIDFYGNNIFRIFQDNSGRIIRDPEAKPEAKILVDNPRKEVKELTISENNNSISINTQAVNITFDKKTALFNVTNKKENKIVIESVSPIKISEKNTSVQFKESESEYFFGGGVQNGRFSHKGKKIAIENQNSWTDGGVASPTPFYWSTNGYAIMWHTFKKGFYDFGLNTPSTVNIEHQTNYLDLFIMVNDGMIPLLNDFYQLTGYPVLIPKFGFYQGHLNAYNRDYWKESEKGILFEDGKKYTESQKDNGGIKESLNGEKNNYQFSARAVIDRYKKHNMPFGWLLPNDGYGAGYGQTNTLDGNIENLRNLTEYAHSNGVEIGLWTQSDLHPKEGVSPLLQRDIVKEVRDAGVRVLKTDVAWVGAGYSFGLNGITDVAQIMSYYGNDSRPFIISLDGWAGTQRYATIWSGDQTGGNWEYIRFHIPTYLGSGLSGQPNITSDMDGIFGGKNPIVNTRDFQWKTFTPMQLNMDGWGSNEKYPHALGEPATSINRNYLKFKSELLPYAYSIAHESIKGAPMIRAMFIEEPNKYTLGINTQYQFLYGPYFLIAPIYKNTNSDEQGNDIRNNIYLPKGTWIDYFNGDIYRGPCIVNNFDAPLWKLPTFVKAGAIIPLTNPNNNIHEIIKEHRIYELYPNSYSQFTEYNDDGATNAYLRGEYSTTKIESHLNKKGETVITVHPTKGRYKDQIEYKSTEFRVNATKKPKRITARLNNKNIKLTEVNTIEEFNKESNCYFYSEYNNLNRFSTLGSDLEKFEVLKNPQILIKIEAVNTIETTINLTIKGYEFASTNTLLKSTGQLNSPSLQLTDELIEAYTVNPKWEAVDNADYYEIELEDQLYTTIKGNSLVFENLVPETTYDFKIRAVNKEMNSDWKNFSITTKSNPLEFAVQNISATIDVEDQSGSRIHKLFDFDEASIWHTKWGKSAIPFNIIADLKTINQLDKLHYLPRDGAGNGTIIRGSIYYSSDKKNWTKESDFNWDRDDKIKIVDFKDKPTAKYIKLEVTEAVGNFGSGKQLYVFKVPHTESYIPGDINNDKLLDANDLTSYTNYTGLRLGDADFEGYISKGDVNQNNLIDAYDISVLTTQLKGGIKQPKEGISGEIKLIPNKKSFNIGDELKIIVSAKDLKNINALSFALPYDDATLEYEGLENINVENMANLTNDRLHGFGLKALYPTFVNIGEQNLLTGDVNLFTIKFKVKKSFKYNLKATDIYLINQKLDFIEAN